MYNFFKVLFLLALLMSSLFAQQTKFKVSYDPEYAPFSFNSDGKPKGLFIDIWTLWAKTNNYEIEFIDGKLWDNAINLVKKGEADFFLGTNIYEDWMKGSQNYYETSTSFFMNENNQMTIDSTSQAKVGIVGNDYESALLNIYPNVKIVVFENYDDALKSILENKIDLIYDDRLAVNFYLFKNDIFHKIKPSNFFSIKNPIKAISNSQDKVDIFTNGFNQIEYDKLLEIENKWILNDREVYFKYNNSKKIILTKQEKDFIKNTTLKIAVSNNWKPIVFNEQNKPTGIAADIFEILVKKLGLKVEYNFFDSFSEQLNSIKNKSNDIIFSTDQTNDRLSYALFSNPYLSFPISIVTSKNENFIENISQLEGKKIAIGKNYTAYTKLREINPKLDFISVDKLTDGLDKVKDNEAYAYIDIKPNLLNSLNNKIFDNLKITGNTGLDYNLRFMVRDDYKILVSILNKGILSLSTDELNIIVDNWMHTPIENDNDYILIFQVIGIGLFLFLIILYKNYKTEQTNKKLENIVNRRTSELKELNQKQIAIYDTVNVGVLVVEKRIVKSVNKKTLFLFGYDEDELLDKSTKILYKNEEDFLLASEKYKDIDLGNTISWEQQLIKKNGELFWVNIYIKALNPKKLEKGIVVTIEDISLQKQAIKDIENAKISAEYSAKMKSDFLANISHEIRTPMNSIIGITYLLQETNLSENQIEYTNKLDKAAKDLLNLINDVLDYSKIESGKMILESVNFNFDELLANIYNSFSSELKRKNLELSYKIDNKIPRKLKGDSIRFSQILVNMIENAIKFSNRGAITVNAKLIENINNKVRIQFFVKDRGIGMSEEQIKKLFTTFPQADSSTTRKYSGTGLGLTISKHIINLMNGHIKVESVQNEGSTFIFDLELEENTTIENTQATEKLQNLNILVVDDNPLSLKIISNVIEAFKYPTTCLRNGEEAIKKLIEKDEENNGFDLILLDDQMPNMNGFEVLSKIENELNLKKIPNIIMMTNSTINEIENKIKSQITKGVMTKPFSSTTLFNLITNIYSKKTPLIEHKKSKKSNIKEYISKLAGTHLLLVEDNLSNQEIATKFLEKAHITIDIANNGKEGLEKALNNTYDGILMDCQMPIMDGYEATKQIRGNDKLKNIPIIAMTANSIQGDKEKCIAMGMSDYISKPIDIEKMFTVLSNWITPKNPLIIKEEENISNIDYGKYNSLNLESQKAISRMANDENIYMNQLHQFSKSQKTFKEDIILLIEKQDFTSAKRIAHTLKGLSGTIGAELIYNKAKKLEKLLTDDINDLQIISLINELKNDLNELIHKINLFFEINKEKESSDILDDKSYYKEIEELKKELKNSNSKAINRFKKLEETFKEKGFEKESIEISNSIENFEFDEALDILEKLK